MIDGADDASRLSSPIITGLGWATDSLFTTRNVEEIES